MEAPTGCCFNPRHPRGVATSGCRNPLRIRRFNPRHPRGVATMSHLKPIITDEFQSTPPAWGGDTIVRRGHLCVVSIPATRVGWRLLMSLFPDRTGRFNPRHPRGVATQSSGGGIYALFQSPPPAWGGDKRGQRRERSQDRFNPRHPRGVATRSNSSNACAGLFQSPPPAWGGDISPAEHEPLFKVSIPATRVGWRLVIRLPQSKQSVFQSPPPAWGGDSCVIA